MKELSKKEILSILGKVKTISETERNPDWGDNKRRMRGGLSGKVCNRAAGPKDLGATHRDQSMTKKMRFVASLGYLDEFPRYGYPYFRLTSAGGKFLTDNTKS